MQSRIRTIVEFGHDNFFRTRLLVLNPDQIAKMIDQMDKDITGIRQEAMQMSWYMRGGVSYEQALQLSVSEREIISKIIKENMETTKKSGLPFF